MHKLYRPALALFVAASLSFAAPSKEMVQLQRDVAQLQDQIRQLQSALNERMAALQALMQQSLETSTKTNTNVAVLESGLRERLSQQLAAPISSVSTKVDQMATEFQGVRENVSAMNESLTKMQAQIVDLANAVKVLQAPPAPPPAMTGAGVAPGGQPAPSGPPAGMSAKQLYDSALTDRSRGNFDLSMQGFQEYLKWFNDTPLAPNAQFYIGQLHYDKAEFDKAVGAFDLVLEKYGENNKSADAHYMKGMALLKGGEKTKAGQEFLIVIQKYPSSEVAAKAKAQRKALGMSVPSASAAPAGKGGAARKRR